MIDIEDSLVRSICDNLRDTDNTLSEALENHGIKNPSESEVQDYYAAIDLFIFKCYYCDKWKDVEQLAGNDVCCSCNELVQDDFETEEFGEQEEENEE